MLNRIKPVIFLVLLVILFSLGYISYYIKQRSFNPLLIILPKVTDVAGIDLDTLEEVNEDNFLLTYEIISEKNVAVNKSVEDVFIKETNYSFPFVMNFNILSGSFFDKEAQERNLKHAVLNKKSAFEIFGDSDVRGLSVIIGEYTYEIVGVIDDMDDKNLTLYIPLTNNDKRLNTFMVLLDENGISKEYVLNSLKQYGISDSKYDFIDIGMIISSIYNKLFMSLKIFAIGFGLLFLKSFIQSLINTIGVLKKCSRQLYLGQLLIRKFFTVLKLLMLCVLSAGICYFSLIAFLSIVSDLLNIFNSPEFMWKTYPMSFGSIVLSLQQLFVYSNVLTVVFIILFFIFLIII